MDSTSILLMTEYSALTRDIEALRRVASIFADTRPAFAAEAEVLLRVATDRQRRTREALETRGFDFDLETFE